MTPLELCQMEGCLGINHAKMNTDAHSRSHTQVVPLSIKASAPCRLDLLRKKAGVAVHCIVFFQTIMLCDHYSSTSALRQLQLCLHAMMMHHPSGIDQTDSASHLHENTSCRWSC